MPEFLYRFRPVRSLLGTTERESELRGKYIYFASPSQLNDPQEGFRDIVWRGDPIVWRNLFKHFFSSLAVRNYQYFSVTSFDDFEFPIAIKYSATTPQTQARLFSAVDEFLDNSNVKRHLELLSSNGRNVRRAELLLHLRALHPLAMHVISKMLVEQSFITKGFGINGATQDELLETSNAILNNMSTKSGAFDQLEIFDLAKSALFYLMRKNLMDRYDNWKSEKPDKWLRLNAEFPDEYANHLERLCTPEWYVACFMDSCANSAIWGSYGENHRGVCLKFRTEALEGKPVIKLNAPAHHPKVKNWWAVKTLEFYKVDYESEHLDLDFFRSLAGVPEPILQSDWYTGPGGELSICMGEVFEDVRLWQNKFWEKHKLSITSKTRHWEGESEYRLLLTTNFQNAVPEQDRCLRYNFDSLEGIIFGIKTSNDQKFKLMRLVEDLCLSHQRKGFNFYQAYYDPASKDIEHVLIATV